MKTLARTGSILSFIFFAIPGLWLAFGASASEPAITAMGLILLGIACFAGTLLWVIGEKVCSKPERDLAG